MLRKERTTSEVIWKGSVFIITAPGNEIDVVLSALWRAIKKEIIL